MGWKETRKGDLKLEGQPTDALDPNIPNPALLCGQMSPPPGVPGTKLYMESQVFHTCNEHCILVHHFTGASIRDHRIRTTLSLYAAVSLGCPKPCILSDFRVSHPFAVVCGVKAGNHLLFFSVSTLCLYPYMQNLWGFSFCSAGRLICENIGVARWTFLP